MYSQPEVRSFLGRTVSGTAPGPCFVGVEQEKSLTSVSCSVIPTKFIAEHWWNTFVSALLILLLFESMAQVFDQLLLPQGKEDLVGRIQCDTAVCGWEWRHPHP